MSRHLLTLHTEEDRKRARTYVNSAPPGTRVEFKSVKRSLPQNDLMWAMLTDISAQKEHFGRKYTPEVWKLLMMDGLGREMKFVPSLDGSTVVPLGQSSSDLSREEMTALIDFIQCWGAENSVTFHGQREQVA